MAKIKFEVKDNLKDFSKVNSPMIEQIVELESVDQLIAAIYEYGKAEYERGQADRDTEVYYEGSIG